jgi:hypothetical protein
MARLGCYAKWAAAIVAMLFALLLGAVIVCFGAPFAYGVGSDIIAMTGPWPVMAALALAGVILLRRPAPRLLRSLRNRSPGVPARPISVPQTLR